MSANATGSHDDRHTHVRLHTPAEAAEQLTVTERWLRRRAAARAIPCTFLGKHLRFSDIDLRDIVDHGRRPPRRWPHPSTR